MPIRSFRNSAGIVWQVWNVTPGARTTAAEERRAGIDRRSPDPVLRYSGPERRQTHDRRRVAPACLLSPQLASGWLTFECPDQKRRLVPVPPNWDALDDAALERLCEQASPVPSLAAGPPSRN